MKSRVPYFPGMTGLRGFMASYVCIVHLLETAAPGKPVTNPLVRFFLFFGSHQYLTIDAFFVLSGFLITCLLLKDRDKPHFFHNFYWRRALRILPVFLIAVVVFRLIVPDSGEYVVLCFLFIANFSPRFGVNIASGIWTLCIEEQFYLLWPQAVRRCKTSTIAAIAAGLIVFSTLLRPLVVVLHHGSISDWYTFYRMDGLGFGILAACAYMAPEELSTGLRRPMKLLLSRTAIALCIVGLVAVPFTSVSRYQEFVCISLTNFLTFRTVYALAQGHSNRFFHSKPMIFMGGISYAFYLYQGFVINEWVKIYGLADPSHGWRLLGRGVAVFAISAAISLVSLFLVEKPAQYLRPYLLRRPANTEESLATKVIPEKIVA